MGSRLYTRAERQMESRAAGSISTRRDIYNTYSKKLKSSDAAREYYGGNLKVGREESQRRQSFSNYSDNSKGNQQRENRKSSYDTISSKTEDNTKYSDDRDYDNSYHSEYKYSDVTPPDNPRTSHHKYDYSRFHSESYANVKQEYSDIRKYETDSFDYDYSSSDYPFSDLKIDVPHNYSYKYDGCDEVPNKHSRRFRRYDDSLQDTTDKSRMRKNAAKFRNASKLKTINDIKHPEQRNNSNQFENRIVSKSSEDFDDQKPSEQVLRGRKKSAELFRKMQKKEAAKNQSQNADSAGSVVTGNQSTSLLMTYSEKLNENHGYSQKLEQRKLPEIREHSSKLKDSPTGNSKYAALEEQYRKLNKRRNPQSLRKKMMGTAASTYYIARRFANAVSEARSDDEDSDTADNVIRAGSSIAYAAVSTAVDRTKAKAKKYAVKVHESKVKSRLMRKRDSSIAADKHAEKKKKYKKFLKKKQMKKQAAKKSVQTAKALTEKLVKEIVETLKKLVELVAKLIAEHPVEAFTVLCLLLIILILMTILSSCSAVGSGGQTAVIGTTFTADDADILAVEQDYKDLEEDLQDKVDSVETDNPGYDEYQYHLDEIGHDPFQLAALLTVLYEDYTQAEVQTRLKDIFALQYNFFTKKVVETRSREETRKGKRWVSNSSESGGGHYEEYTYKVTVYYQYYILHVYLENHSISGILDAIGLTEDEKERYYILLSTYGNKPYLFGSSPYLPGPGDDDDDDGGGDDDGGYEIPPDYLTDEQFARMMKEAKKYIGMRYVWGGDNPSTGFDCSGYVSWVINHCGNGWNVGRQTAN
nr:hypothetical protein [Lachnospiraceae bacterium]